MFFKVEHPCIRAKLTLLRDRRTSAKEFRECVGEITSFLAYEALKNLDVEEITVETPLAAASGCRILNDVVIIPILRAGLGMFEGILRLVPNARVGFVGLERDEATAQPREYYCKLPVATKHSLALVVDPMLATGGSLSATVDLLRRKGFGNVVVLTILSAPEGVARMEHDHPGVKIYSGGLDSGLNEHQYIVPGLGDAGDRLFLFT